MFITYYSGIAENGLFAIATKIPSIITIVTEIFLQAWLLSAIEEYDSDDRDRFYSTVYQYYKFILIAMSFAIIPLVRPLFEYFFQHDYTSAWRFVPPLVLGVVFYGLSQFLWSSYIVSKKTRGATITSLISGVTNVVLNILLIPIWGGMGAAIVTMISFLIVWILRWFNTRSLVNIQTDFKKTCVSFILLFGQCLLVYLNLNLAVEGSLHFVLAIAQLIIYREELKQLVGKGKELLKRR